MRSSPFFRHTPFDAAIERLREGRPGEAEYGRRVVLLLTIPAFDDPVARDVRRAPSGDIYVVRTVWQRALDLPARSVRTISRSSSPALGILDLMSERKPSLWSTNVPVDAVALDRLLASVASVTVPCRPSQDELPLDATIFELTFVHGLSETRYRWGGPAPEPWAPLADFANRLLRLVDEPQIARHP